MGEEEECGQGTGTLDTLLCDRSLEAVTGQQRRKKDGNLKWPGFSPEMRGLTCMRPSAHLDRGPGRRVLEKERSLHALWLRCMRRCLSHPGTLVANKPDSGCTAVRGCSLLFRLPTTLPKRE